MLAAFLLGNEFTPEEKRRIWEYYDPITTGDSSLSESIQSIVACDVGEIPVAHRYLVDGVTLDLADLHGNVRDGVHVASCGGTWMAFVYGFAGMRDYDGEISFRPVMPPHWKLLRFKLRVRGSLLEVQLRQGEARYRLLEGPPLTITHREQVIELADREEHLVHDSSMRPPELADIDRGVAETGAAGQPSLH
jgi:alpha,alpha-trehalose phosphorylase